MDEFFGSNPGMSSRIAHHLDLAAYELDELVHIGRRMMAQSNYYLSAEAEAAFSEYLTHHMASPASPTPAASATNWTGPASAMRTVSRPTWTAAGTGTT
jgi:hypothetical protein